MIVRRTAYLITDSHSEKGWILSPEKITCEVCGEMNTGTKVWRDVKTGEQHFLLRMCGKYYFYNE